MEFPSFISMVPSSTGLRWNTYVLGKGIFWSMSRTEIHMHGSLEPVETSIPEYLSYLPAYPIPLLFVVYVYILDLGLIYILILFPCKYFTSKVTFIESGLSTSTYLFWRHNLYACVVTGGNWSGAERVGFLKSYSKGVLGKLVLSKTNRFLLLITGQLIPAETRG